MTAEIAAAAASATPAPASGAQPRARRLMRLMRRLRMPFAIYLACTGVYCGTAGGRLLHHSSDNHLVYLADSFLHGRLSLRMPPPTDNDWAALDVLRMKDGRVLKGAYVVGHPELFRTSRGAELHVTPAEIRQHEVRHFVSFPPFPALLMLPGVALWGLAFNDVLFTALLAGLGPALIYMILRRLRETRRSDRTAYQDTLLTGMFAVGSVYYYSSVLGQVWYTAHVVGVALCALYTLCALDARAPFVAGLAVGCGYITRTPMLLMFPLFVWEALRVSGAGMTGGLRAGLRGLRVREAARRIVTFGVPVTLIFLGTGVYNYARFGNPLEFGHTYLAVRWVDRIQRYGLFNYEFLSRNLAAAFVLLPRLLARRPWVQVSWHGLSLLATTPLLLYAFWPRRRSALHWPLWITILAVALPSFLYQNDGWIQFGYRFSLDYMIFLTMLIAVSGRPLRKLAHALVIAGVAVNLFGAVTFDRANQFYYQDSFFPSGSE